MQILKGLLQVSLQDLGSFRGVWAFTRPPPTPPYPGLASTVLGQGVAVVLVLHQERLGARVFLLSQLMEEAAHSLQSHILGFETEAQRGRRRRPADAC